MTRKIKKLLFIEEGWLSIFLKPTIIATNINNRVDIEFTYKYNWLGVFTLNIVQLLFDLFYYGIGEFNIKNYFNKDSCHRVVNGIICEYFSEKELKYLKQFPHYPRVVYPSLKNMRTQGE